MEQESKARLEIKKYGISLQPKQENRYKNKLDWGGLEIYFIFLTVVNDDMRLDLDCGGFNFSSDCDFCRQFIAYYGAGANNHNFIILLNISRFAVSIESSMEG